MTSHSDNIESVDIENFKGGETFFNQLKDSGVADEAFIREIVTMFLEEGRIGLDLLYEAIRQQDLKGIKLNAHKLKSSFTMFDLIEILPDIRQLEKTNVTNVEEMFHYIDKLKVKCNRAFQLIELKYL
jgi:HPt (histidine-containing phosphotransfer) domain-containing protein